MQKKIATILSLLLLIILGIAATKKDKLTPYKVVLPEFVEDYFEKMPEVPDNPLTEEGVALGRKLFYDAILSSDYSMSCATCHQQQYAFSDPRFRSIGVNGHRGKIQSMSIVNLAWSNFLFWDGRSRSLEHQANEPITNPIEMASDWTTVLKRLNADTNYRKDFYKVFNVPTIDSIQVLKALAQFERTIVSFNSKFDRFYYDAKLSEFNELEERGLEIFMNAGSCNHCHSDVLLTDNFFRNNGLSATPDSGLAATTKKIEDIGKFKVPTLRNIALTAPYMHDGRYKTLEEVVNFYFDTVYINSPNLDEHMSLLTNRIMFSEYDRKALVAFLKTFTDSTLITNPKFQDPIKDKK